MAILGRQALLHQPPTLIILFFPIVLIGKDIFATTINITFIILVNVIARDSKCLGRGGGVVKCHGYICENQLKYLFSRSNLFSLHRKAFALPEGGYIGGKEGGGGGGAAQGKARWATWSCI